VLTNLLLGMLERAIFVTAMGYNSTSHEYYTYRNAWLAYDEVRKLRYERSCTDD
jgi:hypothetical protein